MRLCENSVLPYYDYSSLYTLYINLSPSPLCSTPCPNDTYGNNPYIFRIRKGFAIYHGYISIDVFNRSVGLICWLATYCVSKKSSSDPFYVVTYYIKLITTSWIHSMLYRIQVKIFSQAGNPIYTSKIPSIST